MAPEAFGALEPGVYTVKRGSDEPQVALLSRHHVLFDLDGHLVDPVFAPEFVGCIEWMRPLERQGGLSGAMYWGEAIR